MLTVASALAGWLPFSSPFSTWVSKQGTGIRRFAIHPLDRDYLNLLPKLTVCLGTVQYWWISVGFVIVQLRAVFYPSDQYLSIFCEAFSWTILDSSSFSLFQSPWSSLSQVGMPSYCCSSSDFLQSHYTVLLSSFAFLISLFTLLYFSDPSGSNNFFLSSLLLSHWSKFSAMI